MVTETARENSLIRKVPLKIRVVAETPEQDKSLKETKFNRTNVKSVICQMNEFQCVNGHKSFEYQLGCVIHTTCTEK